MKITIYTTKDCSFSKQEKDYLKTNSLQYGEKDLEANKDFLTEMMTVSNNFAGTPVTKIEKDDGTISVLKGFTKEEFDTTLGLGTAPGTVPPAPAMSTEPTMSATPPVMGQTMSDMPPPPSVMAEMPPAPPVMTTPVMTPPEPTMTPPMPPPVMTPPAVDSPDSKINDLSSVLNKLEDKAVPVPPPPTMTDTPAVAGAAGAVNPTIPDFPGK